MRADEIKQKRPAFDVRPARYVIAFIGALFLIVRVATELDRNYVNYNKWMLDYSQEWYFAPTVTVLIIVFGQFPVWIASLLLVASCLLQFFAVEDSWEHIGRIAHGDDFGVVFVYMMEFFFLIGLASFTLIYHITRAIIRAKQRKQSSSTESCSE